MIHPSSAFIHHAMAIINLIQAGTVAIAGIVTSDPVVSAMIGGMFLLINGAFTVFFTRYLEKRDERKKKAQRRRANRRKQRSHN